LAPEAAPPPGAFQVLVLDRDAARGRAAAAAIEGCGYAARSADGLESALRAAAEGPFRVLIVERACGGAGSAEGALGPADIDRLRESCGASVVVEWSAAPANGGGERLPEWAAASARGLDALVGCVARQASAAEAPLVVEVERMRRAVAEARAAAHDMSQPLTTILARAQLLMSRVPADDPNHRALGIIAQEAERLAQTVQRFQVLRAFPRRQD
jgi:signal transduction histidine kinase